MTDEIVYKIVPDQTSKLFGENFDHASVGKLEAIVEWFYENYPDCDYVIMGHREIIIKDKDVAMMYKLVWG